MGQFVSLFPILRHNKHITMKNILSVRWNIYIDKLMKHLISSTFHWGNDYMHKGKIS